MCVCMLVYVCVCVCVLAYSCVCIAWPPRCVQQHLLWGMCACPCARGACEKEATTLSTVTPAHSARWVMSLFLSRPAPAAMQPVAGRLVFACLFWDAGSRRVDPFPAPRRSCASRSPVAAGTRCRRGAGRREAGQAHQYGNPRIAWPPTWCGLVPPAHLPWVPGSLPVGDASQLSRTSTPQTQPWRGAGRGVARSCARPS